MPEHDEMQWLKDRIAKVFGQRESLKHALNSGEIAPRAGLEQLEVIDRELSGLDTQFKILWDAAHPRVSPSSHPAARWAQSSTFSPRQLDCVTTIMLKILDAKCKMTEADKLALTAVYDTIKTRRGERLGADTHALITQARETMTPELAGRIHAMRIDAEAVIPKPEMKAFKQVLGTDMPR
ncbi:MAG: hypothetical protein AB1344_03620 [Pseudomonadota bacterium]